jgi:hypothetical protein
VIAACEEVGRDPATMRFSTAEAGAERVMLMQALHQDVDQIQLIGERLAPLLAG